MMVVALICRSGRLVMTAASETATSNGNGAKQSVAITIPAGLREAFEQEAQERGLTESELALELVCSGLGQPPRRQCAEFTVPVSFAPLFSGDDGYVVVKRTASEITYTPAVQMPFDEVREEFAALQLTEDEILEIARS